MDFFLLRKKMRKETGLELSQPCHLEGRRRSRFFSESGALTAVSAGLDEWMASGDPLERLTRSELRSRNTM